MKIRAFVCLSLLSLSPALAKERAAWEIHVNRFSLKPGQTLRVGLPKRHHVAPTLTRNNQTVEFRPTWDHAWRALVAIPVGTPAGEESLYVDSRAPMNLKVYEGSLAVKIEDARSARETIRPPVSKKSLLKSEDEEQEEEIIREFLRAAMADSEQRWRGLFVPPVPGSVVSPFGTTRSRVGQETVDFHRGIDLAGKKGEPVVAPNEAVVLLAKEFNFHGKTVLLGHGQGVSTIYLHLDQIDVKEGDKVKGGQQIGRVGATGFATGPHLHWGLYVDAVPVDPLQWLQEEF